MSHPPYWFFHEYLDEQRRFRVFKNTADTEQEARRMHRQAANYHWVTAHIEPSISPLFTRAEGKDRTLIPGNRRGDTYTTQSNPIPMPDHIRELLNNYKVATP
jgi:hypothetical protein